MKKILSLLLVLFALAQAVQAVPPLRRPYTVQQSDGTTITVYKNGHDHLAFYTTEDGTVVLKGAQGDLCYAEVQGGQLVASDVVAHDAVRRTAEERAFIASHPVSAAERTNAIRGDKRRVNKTIAASTGNGLGRYGTPGMGAVNSIGDYTLPVIMVQFKDKKFQNSTTVEKMNRFYNDEGYAEETDCVGSVRDYFRSQSRGMFSPTFDVVGIVTLDGDVADYGGNDRWGYDKNLDGMLTEAVTKAVNDLGVDFSQYVVTVRNGQGTSSTGVPLVCLLYAGYGEATGTPNDDDGAEDTPWPCEWDCNTTISGTHFNSVFVGNELYSDGKLMGMGVFVHETGHALGLPDFYCTNGGYSGDDACSNWSIMDTGPYVNDARAPIGYNAYERSYLGWLDIPEISEAADISLGSYDVEGDTAAVLIRYSTKECFILENRQPGTWYPSDMGSGLLLMRLAYDATAWEENRPNNVQNQQRFKVLTASGAKMYYNGLQSHLYGNAKKEITSLPLLNGNTLTTAPITKIKKADGHVTFAFKGGAPVVEELGEGEALEQFDFTKDEAYGMTLLSGNTSVYEQPGTECKEGDVTLTFSDGEKDIRWWGASSGNQLRMYSSASATITVPDTLAIVKVTINGVTASKFAFTSDPEGITVDDVTATWTGKSRTVTIAHSGSGNAQIKSIVVRTLRTDEALAPEAPVITPEAGEYEDAVEVSIAAAQDATIVYTVDGSEPRSGEEGSVVYATPFTLTESATVKAVAYDANGNRSDVAEAAYTIVPAAPKFVVTYLGDTLQVGDTITVQTAGDIAGALRALTNPTAEEGLFVRNATGEALSLVCEAIVDEATVSGDYDFTVLGQSRDEDGSIVIEDIAVEAEAAVALPCAVDFLTEQNFGEVSTLVSVSDGKSEMLFCIIFANAEPTAVVDINGDGQCDVSDVTALVEIILTGAEYDATKDLNADGAVDVSDVSYLVGLILAAE